MTEPKTIQELQGDAVHLEGLIEAAVYLDNDGGCENGRFATTLAAKRKASQLVDDLDVADRKGGGK